MDRILMGSTYFFSCYDDFCSKDIDEVEIVEEGEFVHMRQLSGMGKCLFQLKKKKSADEYINHALTSPVGMVVGKFLIPEFVEQIGMSIEDLKKIKPLIDILDNRHKYEEIIYNSYLQNNGFYLTESQRYEAYCKYKEERNG